MLEGPLKHKTNQCNFFRDSLRAHQDEHFAICQLFFIGRIFPQFAYWQ